METNDEEPEQPAERRGAHARWVRITIITDLPERLPVVPGLVEILHAHMGELIDRIIANDNAENEP